MNNYDQHMKHWRNHSKDRYTQQCAAGHSGTGDMSVAQQKQAAANFRDSYLPVFLKQAKEANYPAYVHFGYMGALMFCDEDAIGASRVNSYNEVLQYI